MVQTISSAVADGKKLLSGSKGMVRAFVLVNKMHGRTKGDKLPINKLGQIHQLEKRGRFRPLQQQKSGREGGGSKAEMLLGQRMVSC